MWNRLNEQTDLSDNLCDIVTITIWLWLSLQIDESFTGASKKDSVKFEENRKFENSEIKSDFEKKLNIQSRDSHENF